MAGSLRIINIDFTAGGTPTSTPLSIVPGSVTVFTGPNNSGKSTALREIESRCSSWGFAQQKVIRNIKIDFPQDYETARELLKQFEVPSHLSNYPQDVIALLHPLRDSGGQISLGIRSLQDMITTNQAVAQPQKQQMLINYFSNFYTIRLDGRTRFSLTDPKESTSLLGPPRNHLAALFKDDRARMIVQNLTEEAFGLYFVIDPTGMRQFVIRLSEEKPQNNIEKGLGEESLAFYAKAKPIQEFSDGIQAFVGLVSAILSLPHKIILIDEPEAFLYPPLARFLGRNLALLAKERQATLITSTHSSEFIMGCIEAINDTSIVRLTYTSNIPSARLLSSDKLTTMTRTALLRSTGALRALFHNSVIISEADSDRAFYDEINHRLTTINGRGIKDTLFISAHSWQEVATFIQPFRDIGIPAAGIVDLDVVKADDPSWIKMLKACYIPQSEFESLSELKNKVKSAFDSLPDKNGEIHPIKRQGIYALAQNAKNEANDLIGKLAIYGLFVVPGGELESWLSYLGCSHMRKANWLLSIFQKIGQSEIDENYLNPSNDDVWGFIDRIGLWTNNPNRLGIPN